MQRPIREFRGNTNKSAARVDMEPITAKFREKAKPVCFICFWW